MVRLVGRKEIPYDYLIIASGSTTQSTEGVDSDIVPWKARQNGQTLECVMESQKKIVTAGEIIICGAGTVGVKFAGELADVLGKDKKERRITLISATDRVLTQVNERVGCHAMTVLNRLGVEVSRGSRIISASHDTASARWIIKLDDGTVMSSDCYISTTGPVPNNKFVPDHFLDDQGWVKVDAHLRAVGAATSQKSSGRVYAIGDIVAHQPRTVRAISEQLPVLLATLEADSQGTSSDRGLNLTYSPSPKLPS